MIVENRVELCPEAMGLQELGNELIAGENFHEAILGNWAQGPMHGFKNNTERPINVLTTPFPWLPEGDAERLVEATGLPYPIFSIASAAILTSQKPTTVRIALGGTMNRSLFDDRGRCSVDISEQNSKGRWGTSTYMQNGMSAECGIGYGPVDVLGLIGRIRETA